MTIITVSRAATSDEITAEMDRRGVAIARRFGRTPDSHRQGRGRAQRHAPHAALRVASAMQAARQSARLAYVRVRVSVTHEWRPPPAHSPTMFSRLR